VTTYVEDEVRAGAMSATDPGAANRLRGDQPKVELLALRVRAEYLEMPGLCLTLEQAQRLWSVERRTCEALPKSLTDARFLYRTERGRFVLRASRV
jgi:hypothetical protein